MPRRGRSPTAIAVANASRLTHGLRSAAIIIPGEETAADWQRYHDALLESLDPEGPLETALAARIAELLWRLRRIPRAEMQFIAYAQEFDDVRKLRHHYKLPDKAAAWDALTDEEKEAKGLEAIRTIVAKLGPYATSFIAEDRYPNPDLPPRLVPKEGDLDQLIRYEAHLNRQLNSALHELEARQERRKGNPAPLARVAVSGLPGT